MTTRPIISLPVKRVTFPKPAPVQRTWRCPHGLRSLSTCEACGRHVVTVTVQEPEGS